MGDTTGLIDVCQRCGKQMEYNCPTAYVWDVQISSPYGGSIHYSNYIYCPTCSKYVEDKLIGWDLFEKEGIQQELDFETERD